MYREGSFAPDTVRTRDHAIVIRRLMNKVLARWNSLDAADAAREALPCCGSQAWAAALAARRPFADEASLIASRHVCLACTARGGLAGSIRQSSAHRPEARTDPGHRRVAALVSHRSSARRSPRTMPPSLRWKKPTGATSRDSGASSSSVPAGKDLQPRFSPSSSAHEKRRRNRAARGRRTTTSDHAASSSSLAGGR